MSKFCLDIFSVPMFPLFRDPGDLTQSHPDLPLDDLQRITPLAYDHIRILGRYSFMLNPAVQDGNPRPLKPFQAII